MKPVLVVSLVGALSSAALAQSEYPQEGWAADARFYGAVRTGLAVPPGGRGLTPGAGFELGISKPLGFGFGIHLFGMMNPPEVPRMGIPKADYGLGAMADLRFYLPTVDPLTLYGTFTAGFLAGPASVDGVNVVMPAINPGVGAKVRLADAAFVNFEFGMAGFFIPYINIGVGWEPRRPARPVHAPVPPPAQSTVPIAPRTETPPPPPPVESNGLELAPYPGGPGDRA